MPEIGGVCLLPTDIVCPVVEKVAENSGEQWASDAGHMAGELIVRAMSWWVQTPSPSPDVPEVRLIQSYLLPVVVLVMLAGILAQCIRLIIQRKPEPLFNIGAGLVRYVVVTTMGLLLLGAAVKGCDALAQWMLDRTAFRFAETMKSTLVLSPQVPGSVGGVSSAIMLLFLSVIGGLLALIQWALAFFRQAGILVLAVMLPLAAAGTISKSGREGLGKLVTSLVVLVVYKPVAAVIYVIGFTFVQGRDLNTAMTGFAVLALALVALGALYAFFSWAGVSYGGGGGGLGTTMASFAGGRLGRGGGAPSGATEQNNSVTSANRMTNSGPDSQPRGTGPAPTTPGQQQRGPGGPNDTSPPGTPGRPGGAGDPKTNNTPGGGNSATTGGQAGGGAGGAGATGAAAKASIAAAGAARHSISQAAQPPKSQEEQRGQ